MQPIAISMLTICGIDELPGHGARNVTHVLSVLDPEAPEIEAFTAYGEHQRTTLRFHDIIDVIEAKISPTVAHVEAILDFGAELAASHAARTDRHLLVHCHMGVSRSTAAMLALLTQAHPHETEEQLFTRLREIRPQAWPNSRMVAYADELLDRHGRLTMALRRHYGHQLQQTPKFHEWMRQLGRERELEMAL